MALLLSNCEREPRNEVEPQQKSRYSVHTLGEAELFANSAIRRKLDELNEKVKTQNSKGVQQRSIYNATYDFTIDTENVVKIEDTENGDHSYCFPITRAQPTDDRLENLVLHSNQYNGYDAYIFQYGFTAEDYESLDWTTITDYETSILPIDFDISVFNGNELSRMTHQCDENWVFMDYDHHGDLHGVSPDGTCSVPGCRGGTSGWALTSLSCYFSDDGSGGGGGESTSSGGNSGAGGTTTTPPTNNSGHTTILATPVLVNDPPPQQFTDPNCKELHRLSTSAYTQAAFNHLKSAQTLNPVDKKETGYILRANPDFPFFAPPNLLAGTEERKIVVPYNSLIFCVMHTHPLGSYEMFFHGDIKTLYDYSQVIFDPTSVLNVNPGFQHDTSLFTVMMTVRNNTYAIKIDDPQKLANIQAIYQNKKKLKKFNRDFEDSQYSVDPIPENASQNDLAVGFLKLVEKYDLGISLYRIGNDEIVNNPNNGNNQTSNWKKLKLNTSGTQIVPENCN